MASTLFEDSAPSASLDCRKAWAAPPYPGALPEHLGRLPWPQELASGRPKVEDSPLSTTRLDLPKEDESSLAQTGMLSEKWVRHWFVLRNTVLNMFTEEQKEAGDLSQPIVALAVSDMRAASRANGVDFYKWGILLETTDGTVLRMRADHFPSTAAASASALCRSRCRLSERTAKPSNCCAITLLTAASSFLHSWPALRLPFPTPSWVNVDRRRAAATNDRLCRCCSANPL